MLWVELIGPHGVGKTTLVKELRKRPGNKFRLKNKMVRPLIEGWDLNHPTTWKQLAQWQPFLEVVESLYRQSPPNGKRRQSLCRGLLRAAIIDGAESDEIKHQDQLGSEGMRLSFVLRKPSLIRDYFRTMPVSMGVIILEADAALIAQRNKARAPDFPDFSAWVAEGVRTCARAAEEFGKRTNVLHLDAACPLEENVDAVLGWVAMLKLPTK